MGKESRPATAPTVLNGPNVLNLQHPSVGLDPHVAVRELREFLKVARPEWSHFRRKGTCDIDQVMAKLKSISVNDYWDLMDRVETNVLNEDLHAAGKVVFSKKTLDQFRRQKTLLSAMENLRAPFYRQSGHFAPAPQLLSKRNIWADAVHAKATSHSCSSIASSPPKYLSERTWSVDYGRPASAGGDPSQKRSDAITPFAIQQAAAAGQRPHSVPTGGLHGGCRRPQLRYVRTGKEHQCWAPITKESLADAAQTSEEPTTQSFAETLGRSRGSQSLELSSVAKGVAFDYAESEVDSVALEHQFVKFKKAGSSMNKEVSVSRWNNLTRDTLLGHGDAMLEEQTALDMKKAMVFAMTKGETPQPPGKKVGTVYEKIRHRLREEGTKDAKAALDCHYDCVSIRKNLNAMVNSRRDLNNVKLQAMKALGEEDKVDYAEKFGFIRQANATRSSTGPSEM